MRATLTLCLFALLCAPALSVGNDANLIDDHLDALWKKRGVQPAALSKDGEFLRRLCLDLIGQVPDSREAREFIFSRRKDKREKKIDELLQSWWFARTVSEKMTAYFVGYPRQFDFQNTYKTFRNWLQDHLKNGNNNYAELARAILVDKAGRSTTYIRQFGQAGQGGFQLQVDQLTARTTEAMLGYHLRCAQCHDHPFDKWTQEDFFGFAAFFTKTTLGPQNGIVDRKAPFPYKFEHYKEVPKPVYFDGSTPKTPKWREEIADKIIADKQFARTFVNRVWAWFFGKGIVNPLDQFNDRHRPVAPKLLDALADDFIENEYDIRHLIRVIVTSKVYQRTSKGKGEVELFSRARVRPMTPEAIFQSISHATGLYPDKRRELRGARLNDDDILDMMGGSNTTRAQKKYYVVKSWLVDMLVRTSDEGTVSNYSNYSANIQQVLHMLNKDLPLFSGARSGTGGTLDEMLKKNWTVDEVIDEMFLSTLSRFATKSEKDRCEKHIRDSKTKEKAYEEIYWALMNTDEFIFNH